MTTDPPPRRKWHLTRWLIVITIAAFCYTGWRAHTYRTALNQAKALGWLVTYTDAVDEIQRDWTTTFKKQTWMDEVTRLGIPKGEQFQQRLAIVQRLNPKLLRIYDAPTLRDLSTLDHLPALREVWLSGCTGLTNVDALARRTTLRKVRLDGSPALLNEPIAALRASLPNTEIVTFP